MTIEEQLKEEILSRYKSIREFASMTTIPYSTIDSVLKRGIKNSGVGTVIKIFSFLDIDVESIASGSLKLINPSKDIKKELPTVSDEESLDQELISRLCKLSPGELEKVDAFVQGLLAAR